MSSLLCATNAKELVKQPPTVGDGVDGGGVVGAEDTEHTPCPSVPFFFHFFFSFFFFKIFFFGCVFSFLLFSFHFFCVCAFFLFFFVFSIDFCHFLCFFLTFLFFSFFSFNKNNLPKKMTIATNCLNSFDTQKHTKTYKKKTNTKTQKHKTK